MDKDVFFDLEATCWKDKRKKPNETIEIGAVMLESGEEISCFDAFVKPKVNPVLSGFCRELTTITQADVDSASPFGVVIDEFVEWIGDARLWSWGLYDRRQLERDCLIHGRDSSFLVDRHYNFKNDFSRQRRVKKRYGMTRAMRLCGIPMTGTHHRGIDDARNISRIFSFGENRWWYIENSIPTT